MQPGHDSNNQVPGSLKNAIQVLAHFFLMILLISPLNSWRSWCYMICQETQAAADRVGMGDQVYAGLLRHKFRGLLHLHAKCSNDLQRCLHRIASPLLSSPLSLPARFPGLGLLCSEHERAFQRLTQSSLEPSWPAGFSWRAERSPAPRGPNKATPVRMTLLTICSPALPQARQLCSPRGTRLWLTASLLKIVLSLGHCRLRKSKMVADGGSGPAFPATLFPTSLTWGTL